MRVEKLVARMIQVIHTDFLFIYLLIAYLTTLCLAMSILGKTNCYTSVFMRRVY
jgi:hypothetical protein